MDKTIKHIDGNIGGYLVGRRHSEGGIKAINKSTNQPLEMEGGEVVITRNAVSDNEKREFEGEMLTNKQILSRINEGGGGVSFEKGGEIHAYGNKYNYGGHLMTDHEILHTMAVGGEINELEDFDFENEEYALGGTINSWSDLEGASLIQSGFNYPPSRMINYSAFPIYLFPEYKDKKRRTLENPYKFDVNDDGSISVYIYKDVNNIFIYEEIHKLKNITFIYDYIESLKYYQSDSIVACMYDFNSPLLPSRLKGSYKRKIQDLEYEYGRFIRGYVKNKRGLNIAIDELVDYINDANLNINASDLYSKVIKRVYYTQAINYKNTYTKTAKTFPYTLFENYGEKDYFIIMHNPNHIIGIMKMVNLNAVKYNLNYLYIEFEDGSIWFNQMSFLPTYKNASYIEEIFEIKGGRDSDTINILTSCAYENNNPISSFVLQDSEKAFEQIDSLNKGGVTQPTPTPQNTQSSQTTSFKVGDAVKYIGTDLLSIKNGDIGKIIRIPNQDQYDVEFKNGSSVYVDEIDLKLFMRESNPINDNSIQKFQVGDEVMKFSESPNNIFEVKSCDKINGEWFYDIGNIVTGNVFLLQQNDSIFFADESSRYDNEFNIGDKVRVVYPNRDYFGNIGIVESIINSSQIKSDNPSGKIYNVKYELYGTNADGNQDEGGWQGKDLILLESANATQPIRTTPKFKVGDRVRKLDAEATNIYDIEKYELLDDKWVYDLKRVISGVKDYQVRETNLVLTDESTRYNNEFNVGDIVQVVFDSDDDFANIGTITQVETMAINGNRVENPSKKLYRVDYNIVYGEKANKTRQGGNWEGKDLQLISSSTNTSTQATQTPLTPMTPSTNAGARVKLTIGEQDLQNQINDLTDLLNLTPEYDFEDRIAISQELTTLQQQMNVYVADSTIQNEFYNTGKISKDQSVIDLMLSADCVKLSPRPTNTNLYQNGFNPNGKPTALNKFNYDLIHTEQFQRWFGNYGLAYNYSKIGESNLGLSSQVVNSDGEPLVVYMGVGREFEKITFARFPIGYFAVNEAYAEWFATTKADDGVGYVLPFFLNIRKPLDFSMFGIDEVSPKDFFDWLYLETGMTGKELGFDDRYFLPNCPSLEVWRYIRFTPNFLNKLKEYKICDGIHFYENNPSNPVNANNYMTEVWTIFYSNQCKLASQSRSEMILSANNSFLMKKGGLVK